MLKEKLAARSAPETGEAEKVVRCVEEGIDLTRNLARGFFSPELDAEGLIIALQHLAETGNDSGLTAFWIATSQFGSTIPRLPTNFIKSPRRQ